MSRYNKIEFGGASVLASRAATLHKRLVTSLAPPKQ
jgi:hypothetical protein